MASFGGAALSKKDCTMKYTEPTARELGNERILSVADVCNIMGFCPTVAAQFMKESGYCLAIHRRLFILESSLLKYLHDLEVA